MFENDPKPYIWTAMSGQRIPVTSSAPRSGSRCIKRYTMPAEAVAHYLHKRSSLPSTGFL